MEYQCIQQHVLTVVDQINDKIYCEGVGRGLSKEDIPQLTFVSDGKIDEVVLCGQVLWSTHQSLLSPNEQCLYDELIDRIEAFTTAIAIIGHACYRNKG